MVCLQAPRNGQSQLLLASILNSAQRGSSQVDCKTRHQSQSCTPFLLSPSSCSVDYRQSALAPNCMFVSPHCNRSPWLRSCEHGLILLQKLGNHPRKGRLRAFPSLPPSRHGAPTAVGLGRSVVRRRHRKMLGGENVFAYLTDRAFHGPSFFRPGKITCR